MTAGLEQQPAADPAAAFAAGNAALAAGAPETAVAQYRLALKAAPKVAEIHNNLATAYLQLGDVAHAVRSARRGLKLSPDLAVLHNTLANAYDRDRRAGAAQRHYRRALQLDPGLSTAAVNLADLLRRGGARGEAAALIDGVLARQPDDGEALRVRAVLLLDAGRADAAAPILERLLRRDPGDLTAANNLAICQLCAGRPHAALELYRDVVARHPERAEAHGNLAQTLQGLGRHDEAVAAFRRALELDPAREELLPFLMQSLMHQCDWPALEPVMRRVLEIAGRLAAAGDGPAVSPFALAATPASPELRLAAARRYAARCLATVRDSAGDLRFEHRHGDGDPALHVGYVSPDFRQHSVATSFLPLLRAHRRDGFRWSAFWIGREEPDAVTAEFEDASDSFVDLRGAAPAAAARAVHDARIDVLVDLAGHTRDSALEIFALRPAPVQAHYLGYGGTLGADCIDYLITDHVHTDAALAAHCSEQPVYLPASFMAAARPELPHLDQTRPEHGLPEDGLVFACFNAAYKIDAGCFAVWMQLLTAAPGSVLWLRQDGDVAAANLRRAAAGHSVDPQRLVFAPRLPHDAHLARHSLADLALDTRWHTGGVTTLDALWAGVPVLTLAGDSHAARTGASILCAAGLDDMVTATLDAYRALGMALAADRSRLARVRARLAAAWGTAPLYDVQGLARALETAYGCMHGRWRAAGPRRPHRGDRPRIAGGTQRPMSAATGLHGPVGLTA